MKVIRYTVIGRVQGVGFRYYVYRHAQRMGIAGRVRNRADGAVEVVACGTDEQHREMEDLLRSGPACAHVRQIGREIIEPVEGFTEFRIEV
ncbi:MAG: acylphosphatase [Acidobacteria bacterium]|nr:acylphosphatase [Acidobacteriota bacterium]